MREMKNSGVAWIGEIPKTWELKTIKQLMIERNEKNRDLEVNTILSLSAKDGVTLYDGEHHSGNKPREDLSDYKIVRENDIVANSMNILSGSVGLSKYTGVVSPVYYIYYPRFDDNVEYFHYIFQCFEFQRSLRGLGNGILIKESENGGLNTIRMRIPSKKLGMQEFPVCSREEQDRIVSKLDSNAKKVDVLIANQEAQIEKLKQYKQSLITEVVTKGLNPDAEMKDSGVEWIGEIPKHWGVVSFKYVTKGSNVGEAIDKEYWSQDNNEKVFYTAGLKPIYTSYKDFPEWKFVNEEDLLLSRNGTPYVYRPVNGAMYTDHIIRVPILSAFNKRFIQYVLQQSISKVVVEVVSIPTWSVSIWNRQKITLPLYEEQVAIADFLDDKCSKIDKLIEIKQSKIAKLNEYKKSLIYEYVTGKKEVK